MRLAAVLLVVFLLPLSAAAHCNSSAWCAWHTSAIVQDRQQPIFTVNGRPFFVYGAAFFYERIPRERWEASLEAYRRMGINTIDLYVMWNWHEVSPGSFDFSGRTNDRRDLRALLAIIHRRSFKVILRPGPVIRNEWRNGGYPMWLLRRPEYDMPLHDVLEGRYPATATFQNEHADAAANEWLHNGTHLRQAARWLHAVLSGVGPWSQDVIAVALDDDQGAYLDNDTWPAPRWHRYMDWLQSTVRSVIGSRVPVFINTYQMKVPASAPVWAWGNWYQSDAYSIGDHDLSQLALSTALLQTQPGKPVMTSEFQAGWLQGADEVAPRSADPTNTTLALHEMLQLGAHGVVNFPVQDTLDPAGWEAPWANWLYDWDAALSLPVRRSARYAPTADFGALLTRLGPYLATLHAKSDLAIAWLPTAYDASSMNNARIAAIAAATIAAQQRCRTLALTCRLVDLRFSSDADLRAAGRIVLPPAGFAVLVTAVARARLATLRVHGVKLFDSVDAAAVGLRPANGRIPDAALLLTPDGRSGMLDVFNASNRPRRIASTTIHLARRDVRIPAFTVGARSARDILLGHDATFLVIPSRGRRPSAGGRVTAPTTRIALAPGQWYDGASLPDVATGRATATIMDFFRDGEPVVILQNRYARVVISPTAGARAFVFEDLQSGLNAFTTIGALRDDVATPLARSARDYIASYTHLIASGTFNRTYACSVVQSGERAVTRCSYEAPDLATAPVQFEKTFMLEPDSRTLSVTMRSSADAVSISAVADRGLTVSGDCAPAACAGDQKMGYRLLRLAYPINTGFRLAFTLPGPAAAPANRP